MLIFRTATKSGTAAIGSVAKFLTIEGGRSLDTLMLRAPQTAGMP
jgi:hypothetical protein